MARVFISYRRKDCPYAAHLIYQALAARFGPDRAFIDVDKILPGEAWRQKIDKELSDCSAIVIVIGRQWKKLLGKMEPEDDPVRHEINQARTLEATMFSVLVNGVGPRTLKNLPGLEFLSEHNALALGTERECREQLSTLVQSVAGCIDPLVRFDMNPVPAGDYTIGSDAGQPYEKPVEIRLTRRFRLSRWTLTMRDFELLRGAPSEPWVFPRATGIGGDRLPAHNLTWLEAVTVCNVLSRRHCIKEFYEIEGNRVGIPDWNGHGFRLPTEAEWEVACQLGLNGIPLEHDDSFRQRVRHGLDQDLAEPTGVADLRQDHCGCYGMLGNIREWCFDTFSLDAYDEFRLKANGERSIDPVHHVAVQSQHVVRGGCFCDPIDLVRPWARQGWLGDVRDPGNGMRVAQTCDC